MQDENVGPLLTDMGLLQEDEERGKGGFAAPQIKDSPLKNLLLSDCKKGIAEEGVVATAPQVEAPEDVDKTSGNWKGKVDNDDLRYCFVLPCVEPAIEPIIEPIEQQPKTKAPDNTLPTADDIDSNDKEVNSK